VKNLFTILTLSLSVSLFLSCGNGDSPIEERKDLVQEVKVLNTETRKITIDNDAHFVSIEFIEGTDISNVEIQIKLVEGVSMVTPESSTAAFDFSHGTQSFTVKKGNTEITYQFKIKFVFDPTSKGWQITNTWGALPEYLSVYKYTNKINNKNVKAYIAVTDMNNTTARFSVLGEAKYIDVWSMPTPTQFYTTFSNPKALMNGGYFGGSSSIGLIVREGQLINPQQITISRTYEDRTIKYYPSWGAFGLNSDGTFSAHWCYTPDGKTIYCYEKPVDETGKTPQSLPSASYPTKATIWKPKEAIGAGPVLIKGGEYKNTWEAEMFDDKSGVGPNNNNPRSAIGSTPNKHLIFFVCEGRNTAESIPGLTLHEVTNLLLEIGCSEAINLDGGGSSCMLINGKETIKPSDGNQRRITSAVAVY